MDWLADYGLFLAKTATIVVAVAAIAAMLVSAGRRGRRVGGEGLEITNLNDKYQRMSRILKQALLPKKVFARLTKQDKSDRKKRLKHGHDEKRRVFVIDFHGDIKASAVASLREEITAVLTEATQQDEVVVRLVNAGGLVHEHGLGASQLERVRKRGVPLTVAVDKVAASGGYLMACVADKIIAAPFAIIGSIGVLAQLPNFNRLLEQHGVDFEQFKAGELKRTVTMFGKNTNEDRARMQEHLEEIHALFKDFVAKYRPSLDLGKVATGEYWLGSQALERGLIDDITTSDDYLTQAAETANVYQVKYVAKKRLGERVLSAVDKGLANFWR